MRWEDRIKALDWKSGSRTMNRNTYRGSRGSRRWLTTRKVVCILLLLAAAGYIYGQSSLERWLGIELPSLVEDENDAVETSENVAPDGALETSGPDPADSAANEPVDRSAKNFRLEPAGRGAWRSPEGLLYTDGPQGETRIEHVMRHARDDPSRDIHGVFSASSRDDILALMDRAYALAKENSPNARQRSNGDRSEWTIDLPETIGYVGGQEGKRRDFPKTNRLKLIVEDDRVITAYPVER